MTISVDSCEILRFLIAFVWGFIWAAALQFTRLGKFLAEERTWITVVIGIGADLIIAFNLEYWAVCMVITLSSIGVILRSLLNEHKQQSLLGRNHMIAVLEDSIAYLNNVQAVLEALLDSTTDAVTVKQVSVTIRRCIRTLELLQGARVGQYVPKRKALRGPWD